MVKVKHWRGDWSKNGLQGAPVLVFGCVFPHAGAPTRVLAIFLALCCGSAFAASEAGPGKRLISYYPVINPATELKGQALIAAIRKGGYVLYLRHSQTGTITPECTQSNLTPAGEEDARLVGNALREYQIPIGRVLSSEVCRVLDTARLVDVGTVEVTEDLTNRRKRPGHNFDADRTRRLAEVPAAGKNTLLVGHVQGGNAVEQSLQLDYGEIIVFRPDGMGGSAAVGRIHLDDWALLGNPGAAK